MRTQPNTTAPDLLATARAYWDAGLCPMPRVVSYVEPAYIDPDGEVRSISWGKYKVKQPDWPTIERWFARSDPATGGMTLLTGSSAHPRAERAAFLQILDIETGELFEEFREEVNFAGQADILYRCVIERTASDAAHVGFLCREIGDTQKITLARREADNKLLIELLQHQPCTVAPTAIRCKPEHPEGGVYRVVHGDWAHPLEISPEQRRILLDIARAFNEVPEKTAHEGARTASDGTRPGDHLNETANIDWWQNLLTHHDWRDVSRPGLRAKGIYYFQRPGKIGNGPSATYGRTGQRLYVFSSNAQPFDPGIDYSPFAAYTLLEHKGNFKQAATALAQAFEMQQDAHQRQNGIVTGQAQTSAATAEDLDNLLRIAPWPECPHEAFYGVMGELAQAVKPYTEADPVTLLVQGLLIAGAIIGDRVFYAVGATRHPPREFAVIVGRTGVGRKGTGLDVARWAMTPAPFLDEEGHEQQPTWTFPTIVKGCGSGEGLISAVRDPNYRLEPVRAPAEGGAKARL